MLSDGPTRPAAARVRGADEIELALTEGRKHQVKRMLAAIGHPVRALHREAVGAVTLDVLVGAFRPLDAREVELGLGLAPRGRTA